MPDNPSAPLEQRISAVLATAPSIQVPEGFAARIAADAHARFGSIPEARPAASFGTIAIRLALAALVLAMVLLARHPGLSPALSVSLQTTLSAEFIALTLYLSRRSLNIT